LPAQEKNLGLGNYFDVSVENVALVELLEAFDDLDDYVPDF
jgi:hypothetical protein